MKAALKKTAKYPCFVQLDGSHPWTEAAPEGYVSYKVRSLPNGKVVYFNFALAKEMGLISSTHPCEMNTDLEEQILETFCLQIINEYDQINNRKFDPSTIKSGTYMATRYLQLQHSNKQGKTSGDGRGIWNGTFEHKGKVWDVSSRGTGVTCLAPGVVELKRPLKTGSNEVGYGCGQAEIDELYGSAILSEIFHVQGIKTERCLAIIDIGKGFGIGVRAAPNLLRPAHLFRYLKQSKHEELKKTIDYLLERQIKNSEWTIPATGNSKYWSMVDQICKNFAEFAAICENEYIFAWMAWDGDNILANAGIIDYGSIRQFGARHDQYRYDDVERFSTNLVEQKAQARLTVQVFAQLADYLITQDKKPLKSFANHPSVKKFEANFEMCRRDRLLYRLGFNAAQRAKLLRKHTSTVMTFEKYFFRLEKCKGVDRLIKVADGVNQPALFNMRASLLEMGRAYSEDRISSLFPEKLFNSMLTSFAINKKVKFDSKWTKNLLRFRHAYEELCELGLEGHEAVEMHQRSEKINRQDRMTGNALIQVVDALITEIKRGLRPNEIQKAVDQLIQHYVGLPEVSLPKVRLRPLNVVVTTSTTELMPAIISRFLSIVDEYKDDI
ncbi:MAG: protein adenylyltransferase SelO family protein [Pseudobdellovibrionaceae bacterium]